MDFWGGFGAEVALFGASQSESETCSESSDSHDASNPAQEDGSESWNISNFQHRVEGSSEWDASRPRAVQRVQDLSLNMSIVDSEANNCAVDERCQLEKEQKAWPFDNSPCRMFGGKKNTRKQQGGRASASFNERTMFKGWFGRADTAKMTPINESSQENNLTARGQSISFCGESVTPGRETCARERYQGTGASKSFDSSTYGTAANVSHASQLSPKPQRPAMNRAMSVATVRAPESTIGQHQSPGCIRSNGRRRPREVPEGIEESSSPERPRQLLKLLRDQQTVHASDFMQMDNRRVLHHIVYQSKLMVSFEEMGSFIARETERSKTGGHWERPPLPLFTKD